MSGSNIGVDGVREALFLMARELTVVLSAPRTLADASLVSSPVSTVVDDDNRLVSIFVVADEALGL